VNPAGVAKLLGLPQFIPQAVHEEIPYDWPPATSKPVL